jgi:hypothetical protein
LDGKNPPLLFNKHLSSQTRNKKDTNTRMLNKLPPELLRLICLYLDSKSILNLRRCNTEMRSTVFHTPHHLPTLLPFYLPFSFVPEKSLYLEELMERNQEELRSGEIALRELVPLLMVRYGYQGLLKKVLNEVDGVRRSMMKKVADMSEESEEDEEECGVLQFYFVLAHAYLHSVTGKTLHQKVLPPPYPASVPRTFDEALFTLLVFPAEFTSKTPRWLQDEYEHLFFHSLLCDQRGAFEILWKHLPQVRNKAFVLCKDLWNEYRECTKFILDWLLREWKNRIQVGDQDDVEHWNRFEPTHVNDLKFVTVSNQRGQNEELPLIDQMYTENELKLCTALFEADETNVLLTDLSAADVRLEFSSASILFQYVDYAALGASPVRMVETLIKLVKRCLTGDDYDFTLAHYAFRLCSMQQFDLARVCFEAGADPNVDPGGVMDAMVKGDVPALKVYMEYGYNMSEREGKDEEYVRFCIVMNKSEEFVQFCRDVFGMNV